jgi:hypothetical protein
MEFSEQSLRNNEILIKKYLEMTRKPTITSLFKEAIDLALVEKTIITLRKYSGILLH